MDHIATVVHCRQDGLTIDENLNCGLLGTVEAEVYLVEAWCDGQDHGLVFIPQEVLRASVDGLDLPWYSETILKLTTLPKPSGRAVLSTQSFIN